MMVVESPSFFSAGTPTTEFGEIMMRFLAAHQQDAAVAAGANGVARLQHFFLLQRNRLRRRCRSSQTSPEDLLTVQSPSSAAKATGSRRQRRTSPRDARD